MKRVPRISFFDLTGCFCVPDIRSGAPLKKKLLNNQWLLSKLIWLLLFSLQINAGYASDVGLYFPANNQTKVNAEGLALAWVDVPVAPGFDCGI